MYGIKILCYVTKTFRNVGRKTLHYDTNVTHLFFSIGVFLYILFERKEIFYIMKDTKLIDIIIPAYKAQNTIDKTVASVAIQNIADKCIVTIVNDGEKGNYKKTVDRFKDMVEIREIKMEQNGGPGVARQFGIDNTSCPYFTCIDADDTFSGAFALAVLLRGFEQNPNNCAVIGSFAEEHPGLQFMSHQTDLVWMFGKLYRRDFIDRFKIRFNSTRANEDNGFNTLLRLCATEQEPIAFIQDNVYFWHSKEDSITRINNCEYSYNQSFVGYTDNMIYAIVEAKKRNPFNGNIMFWATQTMFHLYTYYMQTCERDKRFKDQNYQCCVKYYQTVFQKIRPELSDEIFKEIYSNVVQQSDMRNIAPDVTIYQFLDMLEKEPKIEFEIEQPTPKVLIEQK